MARQVVGFVMLPVYTRFLTPADYGAVGLLTFALAAIEPFIGARLAAAIPKFYFETEDQEARRAVLTSAFVVTGVVSAVAAVLIVVGRTQASQALFGTAEYGFATAIFGLNILTQPVEYTGMMFLRLREQSMLFLWVNLAKMVLQVGLNVLLVVYLGLGVMGVVLSGVVASALFGLGLSGYVFFHSRPRFDVRVAKGMLAFCWPLWFAGLASLYIASSSRLFLRVLGSLDEVGLLELGTKFAAIIGLLIWTPFVQHWEAVSYRYHQDGQAPVMFQTAFLIVSTLLVTAGLGVSIFAAPLIVLMSDSAFHGAAQTVGLLTTGFIFSNLWTFFTFSFMVTDRTRVASAGYYLAAVLITVLFVTLIPAWGAVGAAAAQCLAYSVTFFAFHWLSRRFFDPGIRLGSFLLTLGIAVTVYVVCALLPAPESPVVGVGVDMLVYLFGCGAIAMIATRRLRVLNAGLYHSMLQVLLLWRGRFAEHVR